MPRAGGNPGFLKHQQGTVGLSCTSRGPIRALRDICRVRNVCSGLCLAKERWWEGIKKGSAASCPEPGWEKCYTRAGHGCSCCLQRRDASASSSSLQNPRHHLVPSARSVCDHRSLLCSFCPVSRTPSWTGAALVALSWVTGECGFFHLEMQSARQRKTALFTQSRTWDQKKKNANDHFNPERISREACTLNY